ncbi:MAG: TetR/AcrR family transcriptional regulator [Sutterella wadsworthensis]
MAKKSEDRRRSILNAALDEFEAKGFSAALVEDIAHRAGVSKGTIYGYFKGKEALLLGLAEEVAVLIQKEFDQPSEHASLPLIERLWRTEAGLLADNGHGRLARILRVVWSEGLHRPELTRPIYENF